uniref:Protein phosphatase 1 regulatory inhibitor subunit 14A n=2 Tax=Neoaves TaxID=3078114 RepID=A0A8B9MXQ6_9AVES
MAANRVGRRQGRGGSPGRSPAARRPQPPARSPGLQRRPARVTVKYNRRELQRRLDTEQWIDGRLEELYRGREGEMPDEVNIDDLLELETDEERAQKLQGILRSCTADTEVRTHGVGGHVWSGDTSVWGVHAATPPPPSPSSGCSNRALKGKSIQLRLPPGGPFPPRLSPVAASGKGGWGGLNFLGGL